MNNPKEKSVFDTLYGINCKEHSEKKNGLTYLSWAWAWAEVKKAYPTATYTIYENKDGWNYFTDGKTCWVKTGVTIDGLEHIEYLPVMDFRNKSILLDMVTSYDVNKTIQRSLTKAAARHGLGLYIYAGEDLPEDAATAEVKTVAKPVVKATPKKESKGNEAWKKYYAIAKQNPELDDEMIKQSFCKLVMETTGKSKSSEVTDDEWVKVINKFAA